MNFSQRLGHGKLRTFFAIAGIVLKPPFGPVDQLLLKSNPWHAFHDEGPVLTVMRAQKVLLPPDKSGGATCKSWMAALTDDSEGKGLPTLTRNDWDKAIEEWSPLREDDLKAILECSKMPCNVKLNEYETTQMAAVAEGLRKGKYSQVVLERVQGYQKTQDRQEYEFPGKPVDPWKYFEGMGLKTILPLPAKMELRVRTVDLAPGRVRAVHQVIDRRLMVAPDRHEATLWRRDVYTDHYFDSWGEWADVSCAEDGGSVQVTEAVLLELDLMKKTDLMSKLMRSKMRGATEDNGAVYLNQWFERLKKRAEAGS